MIRVIHDYLKKKRIKAILFKKTLQSSINVLLIDFIDINDHYCSLLLGYTETQIFTQSSQFLLENIQEEQLYHYQLNKFYPYTKSQKELNEI